MAFLASLLARYCITLGDAIGPNNDTTKFLELLEDAEKELYPGCEEFTKFSFITHLMQWKVEYNWTNKSFTTLLRLLKRALPKPANLPNSYQEAN